MGLLSELAILLHQNSYPSIPLEYESSHYMICPFNALPLKILYTDLWICLTNIDLKFLYLNN